MIPKVSIIIPAYNSEKFISRAIHSAMEQTYPRIEIIVVDNGSIDNTFEIASSYNDIAVYAKGHNTGPAAPINYGIQKSTGNWIHWLSADDELYPNAIELMMQGIKDSRFTDYFTNRTLFYSSFDRIDDKGKLIDRYKEYNNNNLTHEGMIDLLCQAYYGNIGTSMIHKTVFEKVGLFDETLPYAEDYEFWMRCVVLHKMRLHLIPQFTLKYRIHEGQLSNKADINLSYHIRDKIMSQQVNTS